MKTTLLIVDMQEGAALSRYHGNYLNRRWWKRHGSVANNIQKLSGEVSATVFISDTRFRIKDHMKIVEPLRTLASHSRQFFKGKDDGSDVLEANLDAGHKILVVGMNTDACVLRTARGLLRKGFNVAVIGDACWTAYAAKSTQPHHDALHRLRKMGIEVLDSSTVRPSRPDYH